MLGPLFDLIASWEPRLREIPRGFLGLEDGLMVHHAVDDRCTCMGGFWTGAIDHGSTGWVAHMMWQYYLYTWIPISCGAPPSPSCATRCASMRRCSRSAPTAR